MKAKQLASLQIGNRLTTAEQKLESHFQSILDAVKAARASKVAQVRKICQQAQDKAERQIQMRQAMIDEEQERLILMQTESISQAAIRSKEIDEMQTNLHAIDHTTFKVPDVQLKAELSDEFGDRLLELVEECSVVELERTETNTALKVDASWTCFTCDTEHARETILCSNCQSFRPLEHMPNLLFRP